MLTLFSCPKAFHGHFSIIQRNAIRSWTLLEPRPKIILIGDEEGTAEICKEFGLCHISEVSKNEFGTPLVNSIFEIAQSKALTSLVCYVNADIILLSDFLAAISKVVNELPGRPVLMVGRRWDVEIKEYLNFDLDWEQRLRAYVRESGRLQSPRSIDYFVFEKGVYDSIPAFALGRSAWDNWLIYYASKNDIGIVDTTTVNVVIHQRHFYSYIKNVNPISLYLNTEFKRNFSLLGGNSYGYTIRNATFLLTQEGVKKAPLWWRYSAIVDRYVYENLVMVIRSGHPFTLPLIICGKVLRKWYWQIVAKIRRLP